MILQQSLSGGIWKIIIWKKVFIFVEWFVYEFNINERHTNHWQFTDVNNIANSARYWESLQKRFRTIFLNFYKYTRGYLIVISRNEYILVYLGTEDSIQFLEDCR